MSISDAIATQEALLAKLEKEHVQDEKDTAKVVQVAKNATKKVDEKPVYKNFMVCYTDDNDETVSWLDDGPHTLSALVRLAAAVPGTVSAKLQGSAVAAAQGRTRLAIIREFKHRSSARITDMFHCRERIAALKAGAEE